MLEMRWQGILSKYKENKYWGRGKVKNIEDAWVDTFARV